MRFAKTPSLAFILLALPACGGGHGAGHDGGPADGGVAGHDGGGLDAILDADGGDGASPSDAVDADPLPDGGLPSACPQRFIYSPLFPGDAVSQTPISFTDPETGHLIFRGAGRVRMGHEMEAYYPTYPPQYFEGRTFGYVLDDAVAAGGTTIDATIQSTTNLYYHAQKLAGQQQGGFDASFRTWREYGTLAGNRFFGNQGGAGPHAPPAGCATDPDGATCDTRKWSWSVTTNDREQRPMRAGDQLQVEFNLDLSEYGAGQGPPVDNTHVRNLLPLSGGCTLNGPPFSNSCYTQSSYFATDSFRYVVGRGTLTPANEDCTLAVPVTTDLQEPFDCTAAGNVGKEIAAGTVSDRLGPAPAGWSGGTATIPYLRQRHDLYYEQMAPSTLVENAESFVQGRFLFYLDFTTGQSTEPYNSLSAAEIAARANVVGPRYSQASCVGCHVNNNRGAAAAPGGALDAFRVRLSDGSHDAHGRPGGDALAGHALQPKAIAGAAEGTAVLSQNLEVATQLGDGSILMLTKPVFDVKVTGEDAPMFSARVAPPLVGLGLLEAIADEDILAHADVFDCDSDGIKGVPNLVFDDEDGSTKIGRFGWRATSPSLRQAVAESLSLDLGVTTTVYPTDDCGSTQSGCGAASAKPELSEADLTRLVTYMRDGAVPPRRDLGDAAVVRGEQLFGTLGCTSCHVATFTTGATSPFLELRHQTIHPYTDLLLHDMGPDLADNSGRAQEGAATSSMWRTPALWGIGLCDEVAAGFTGTSYNQSPNLGPCHYLHDGRAASLLEAVLWHGGEAFAVEARFRALPAADREAVLAFLRSL